jgi:hypothetical protein
MSTLYLETSVVSYLTARTSANLVTAAHQHITARWWDLRRSAFDIWTSELVLMPFVCTPEELLGEADVS